MTVGAIIPFAGELAGLGTAACWATCSLAFASASRRIGATAVNQFRMPVAMVLLVAAHWIAFGELWPSEATSRQVFWLALSGLFGITLGDLFLFHSLALIGPRLGELLMTAAPVVTILLAWLILGETLGSWVILGIAVTMGGVIAVLADRRGNNAWKSPAGRKPEGIVAGLLGAVGQGIGLVLAKLGMGVAAGAEVATVDGGSAGNAPLDPLSATLIRMAAGAVGIWVLAMARGGLRQTLQAAKDRKAVGTTCLATVLGIAGIWLSLLSITLTKTGIGAALMGTVPILMLPLTFFAYGDRPGRSAIVGTFIAVLGVACLFLAH